MKKLEFINIFYEAGTNKLPSIKMTDVCDPKYAPIVYFNLLRNDASAANLMLNMFASMLRNKSLLSIRSFVEYLVANTFENTKLISMWNYQNDDFLRVKNAVKTNREDIINHIASHFETTISGNIKNPSYILFDVNGMLSIFEAETSNDRSVLNINQFLQKKFPPCVVLECIFELLIRNDIQTDADILHGAVESTYNFTVVSNKFDVPDMQEEIYEIALKIFDGNFENQNLKKENELTNILNII